MRNGARFVVAATVLGALGGLAWAAGQPADSKIESVTVYRGQAQVTRVVTLPKESGQLELVIGDLPEQVIGPSLSASGAGGVAIRSVRYRTQAVAQPAKKEIADLDSQIKQAAAEQYANEQMQALLKAKGAHLDKLETFQAQTAQAEMAKGVLDPKTVGGITDFVFKWRETLTAEQIKLHQAQQDVADKLNLLQRQRAELTAGAAKTLREAVIFITKPAAGAGEIRLTYLVGSASWSPAYNVRLDEAGKSVTVEYLANVSQVSGEDWAGVALTLSTATPAMNAESPLLAPFWVGLQAEEAGQADAKAYAKRRADTSNSQLAAVTLWNTRQEAPAQAGWELNRLAAQNQTLELNAKTDAIFVGPEAQDVGGLAVSYKLPGAMSLASRSDQQLIQIASAPFQAEAYYVAIPLLSTYVYRCVNLVNGGAVPLLAGPYSAYVGTEFVGRGDLPLVARGQEVTVGFGVDTQLRAARELVEKSDRNVWGSRVQTFTYRLRLENFRDAPATVRLMDRMPAAKTEDIKITLQKTATPLATDAMYRRDLADKGILRWDVALPTGATGAKAWQMDYTFEMKYAKDAHVGREAAAMPSAMQADLYLEMQKAAH